MDPIHKFARDGRLAELEQELAIGFDVNKPDSLDKYTPLMWAAKNGQHHVVDVLLSTPNIDVDKEGGWNRSTALIKATEANFITSVEKLVLKRANVNKQNDFGATALMIAAEKGFTNIAKFLIDHQANLDKQNTLLYAALILAAEYNRLDIIRMLCEAGAQVDIANMFGKTALIMASEFNRLDAARVLLDFGANVDACSKRGLTSLMLAALKGHEEVVKLLLSYGAKVNIENKEGECALMLSFASRKPSISALLIAKGANKCHIQKGGLTPVMKAAESGKIEGVLMLLEADADEHLHPPIWVPDYAHDSCMSCDQPFDSLVRKHHCRVCGELFCHRCCSESAPIPSGKPRAVIKDYLSTSTPKQPPSFLPSFLVNAVSTAHGGMDERWCLRCRHYNQEVIMTTRPIQIHLNMKSIDGNTALHLAASRGHLDVFVQLHAFGADIELRNDAGLTPVNLLAGFYSKNVSRFTNEFVSELIRMNDIGKHSDLLDLLPEILPEFESPNSVLNAIFSRLLCGLRKDPELLHSLVLIAAAVRKSMEKYPLEEPDLQVRLDTLDGMLVKCFTAEALDSEQNVVSVLQTKEMRSRTYTSEEFARAVSFKEGPLGCCFDHEILSIFGTRQVSIHVDKVFTTCLKSFENHCIVHVRDLFQMRSNCVHWRSCPAVNYYLEGLSKLLFFVIVSLLLLDVAHSGVYTDLVILLFVASCLRELGEFKKTGYSVDEYFADGWNYLDIVPLVLLATWLGLLVHEGHNFNSISPYLQYRYPHGVPPADVTDAMQDNPASKAVLAVAPIPMAIGLLRYVSMHRGLGQYVLTVFSMFADLGNFAIVYVFFAVGFFIAFQTLFPHVSPFFDSSEHTVLALFDASLGLHDFASFLGEPYRVAGEVLLLLFVSSAMVVLLNLVIARFSATHDEVSEQALARWCMMKASNVEAYLLIEETNPLCMLPVPLNLIPAALYPIHWLYILLMRERFRDERCERLHKYGFFRRHHSSRHFVKDASGRRQSAVLAKSMRREVEAEQAVQEDIVRMEKHRRCISICGTVSDMVLSVLCIFPCAVYEIYLCLDAVRVQASSATVYYLCLALALPLFPLLFAIFFCVLLYELVHVRSVFVFNHNSRKNLDYKVAKKRRILSTAELALDRNTKYTGLRVTILRAQLLQKSLFMQPEIYATVRVLEQRLVTQPVKGASNMFFWSRDNSKEFYIAFEETLETDELEISLFDVFGTERGSVVVNINGWIANGRFEGEVKLMEDGVVIGSVALAAKAERVSEERVKASQAITTEYKVDEDEDGPLVILAANDIDMIFHGIKEENSVFPKNPFAYELHKEIKHNFSALEKGKVKMLQEQLDALELEEKSQIEQLEKKLDDLLDRL